MPNCLQRLPTRRNLDAQITNGTRQISRDVEIWRRNLKRLQITLGQITPWEMVFPSMTSLPWLFVRARQAYGTRARFLSARWVRSLSAAS